MTDRGSNGQGTEQSVHLFGIYRIAQQVVEVEIETVGPGSSYDPHELARVAM
jgi:hypothetical protein